jgi:hypothetical protein
MIVSREMRVTASAKRKLCEQLEDPAEVRVHRACADELARWVPYVEQLERKLELAEAR